MKVRTSPTTVTKLLINDIENLDPVSVYLEDYEEGRGRIIIHCWNKVWSSYWGGMGSKTISQFVISCDKHYLAKNLDYNLVDTPAQVDESKVQDATRKIIGQKYRSGEIDKEEVQYLLSEIDYASGEEIVASSALRNGLGYDWSVELPRCENPRLQYLYRILDAVREGLKMYEAGQVHYQVGKGEDGLYTVYFVDESWRCIFEPCASFDNEHDAEELAKKLNGANGGKFFFLFQDFDGWEVVKLVNGFFRKVISCDSRNTAINRVIRMNGGNAA